MLLANLKCVAYPIFCWPKTGLSSQKFLEPPLHVVGTGYNVVGTAVCCKKIAKYSELFSEGLLYRRGMEKWHFYTGVSARSSAVFDTARVTIKFAVIELDRLTLTVNHDLR